MRRYEEQNKLNVSKMSILRLIHFVSLTTHEWEENS